MANLRYFITSMRSKSIIVCGIENFSQRLFDFSSSVGLALEMTVYELSKPSSKSFAIKASKVESTPPDKAICTGTSARNRLVIAL